MRIAFSGAQGVGKTTLCHALEREIKARGQSVAIINEVARDLARLGIGMDRCSTTEDYCRFVTEYVRRRLDTVADYLVHDRTLLDSFSYITVTARATPPFIEMIEWLTRWYIRDIEYYFYLPIEFSLTADDVRPPDIEWQATIDRQIRAHLEIFRIKYATITGDIPTRLRQVLHIIGC